MKVVPSDNPTILIGNCNDGSMIALYIPSGIKIVDAFTNTESGKLPPGCFTLSIRAKGVNFEATETATKETYLIPKAKHLRPREAAVCITDYVAKKRRERSDNHPQRKEVI